VHLQEVAAMTSRLARKMGLSRASELVGLAHDLGKYSEEFQQYLHQTSDNASMEMELDQSLRGSVDHSTGGAQTISHRLAQSGVAAEML
jgi:CRISPR-associated endonuclease/helicase Cas3